MKYRITVDWDKTFYALALLRHEARLFGFLIDAIDYEYSKDKTQTTLTATCKNYV